MNKDDIVQNMISYIEEEEKNIQVLKLAGDSKSVRSDIVNNILNKLDQEVSNEN